MTLQGEGVDKVSSELFKTLILKLLEVNSNNTWKQGFALYKDTFILYDTLRALILKTFISEKMSNDWLEKVYSFCAQAKFCDWPQNWPQKNATWFVDSQSL